jgi:hypothetical protein
VGLKKIISKLERLATSPGRELRIGEKYVSTLGERRALRKMRRRAIEHCVMERMDILGQNMAIYHFLWSVYEDHGDVRREYIRYKNIKRKVLKKYGIELRKP